jgi:hypothetical protein
MFGIVLLLVSLYIGMTIYTRGAEETLSSAQRAFAPIQPMSQRETPLATGLSPAAGLADEPSAPARPMKVTDAGSLAGREPARLRRCGVERIAVRCPAAGWARRLRLPGPGDAFVAEAWALSAKAVEQAKVMRSPHPLREPNSTPKRRTSAWPRQRGRST